MSDLPSIIVDTNILFSALLSNENSFIYIICSLNYRLFICEQILYELFRYKEKIVRYSRLSELRIAQKRFYSIF